MAPVRPAARAISAGTVLLLLAGFANLVMFLLGRGLSRQLEVAVRRAVGASRLQIASLVLAEAVALASVSGLIGIGAATVFFDKARDILYIHGIHLTTESPLLVRVNVIAFLLSTGLALLGGLVPLITERQPAVTPPF